MKELLERWIELLKVSGSNSKKQVREEMEKCLEELNKLDGFHKYNVPLVTTRLLQEFNDETPIH